MRIDGRAHNVIRPLRFLPKVSPYAEGSCEVSAGNTKLLVTASVETELPKWMDKPTQGWITAEYGMLPRSTHTRNKREASQGKQSGRTLEIQRLIGRALRAALDLSQLAGITIRLDCDVICADGGTRTAAISGAWIALYQAVEHIKRNKLLSQVPSIKQVAAISAGVLAGEEILDLCYEEDSQAEFDMNVVVDANGNIVEVQGTAEKGNISKERFDSLLSLALEGTRTVMLEQQRTIAALS